MTRGAWNDVRTFAAKRIEVFPKRVDVLRRVLVDRQSGFLRLGDDAVFHVSDVHDVSDFVAFELEITDHDIGCDSAAKVADVAVIPNRRTAVVKANLAFAQRAKFFNATG